MSRRTKQRQAAMRAAAGRSSAAPTSDSYQNLQARVGLNAGNNTGGASYDFNPISRRQIQLEYMYRGSWLVGVAVDAIADDMSRAGIELQTTAAPQVVEGLNKAIAKHHIWTALGNTVRWARLYGGAGAVMMIDGQDLSEPLRIETIDKGQFKGLYVLDRWMMFPDLSELIDEMGPEIGRPKFYQIQINAPVWRGKRVHYSRVLRFDGIKLPYWQALNEQGWGMSVVERLYDRLLAFDSTTQGAAQLVFKAHLRTLKVDGLKEILGSGGPALEALAKQVEGIRRFQTNEGLSVIDGKDEMLASSYTFSGLSDMMLQFGQQISGSLQIPLVRLFGQSPSGLNASGESDLRTYYDGILARQEAEMRDPMTRLLAVMVRSEGAFDREISFTFRPLWQMSAAEKAGIATNVTGAIVAAADGGLISQATALKELRSLAPTTGVWSNINDQDIAEADIQLPAMTEIDPLPGPALTEPDHAGALLRPQ